MATIARIIVTEPGIENNRQLFQNFIAESKQLLPKGEKHQFILLPAGFLTFTSNDLYRVFQYSLSGTQRGDVMNFENGKWIK